MPFQSFHISSQFSPNWSSGFLVPVGLDWDIPWVSAFHGTGHCASSSLGLQNYLWQGCMHKDCTWDLHTDITAIQMCVAWSVPWGRAPTPDSTMGWVSRQSCEAPHVQAQHSLFLHPPWQISRVNEDTADRDLIGFAATGNLFIQNTGNKPSKCFFLPFSYGEENQLVMYPTLFSLVSSFRTESFARNFFSASSTYWFLTFSGTGWQVW